MKKIFINGKFLAQKQTGVQRYAREIIAYLDKLVGEGEFTIVLPKGKWELPEYKNITIKQIGPLHGIEWEQLTFPLYVMKNGGTALNLCNVAPLLAPGCSTIHDLKVIMHPQFFGSKFRLWYRLLFANQTRRCKVLFTVSEQAKAELLSNYPFLEPNGVVVTPDAWQHYERIGYDEAALTKYKLRVQGFYFAMGSLEPNKNFRWIAEMARRNPNDVFAIAGSLNAKVFANGLGFECPENMRLLGYVTDEEAKTLMRDAKAFLFPSFSEGFGMPPLEALSAGCNRIIVSDIPVMHEIFKENAVYIDPSRYNYDFAQLLTGSQCNAESVLHRYSWKKSAEILLDTLREIS